MTKQQEPKIRIPDLVGEMNRKFDFYIKIVISVLVVAVVTMLLMVAGLVLDAWHFNSAVYKEYSEKTELTQNMQKINGELLDQNKKNQELILELQKQITALLE